MKKKIIVLLTLMAVILGMCACSGTKKTATLNEDDESKPYEIVWYYVGYTGNKDQQMVNDKVNEYLKKKINATLVMSPLDWGPFATKVENIMSSGEKCDIRWINSSEYSTTVFKGAFLSLDELMDKYAPKTKEILGDELMEGVKIDGKIYAVQNNKDNGRWYSVYYRKDIADKYNMDLSGVKTLEDLYPFLEIVKKNEPNMFAYGIGGGRTPWQTSGYDDFGGNGLVGAVNESDEVVNLYETDLFMNSALKAREMYNKGFLNTDAAVNDNVTDLISTNRIFCYIGSDRPGQIEEFNASKNVEWASVRLTEEATCWTSDAQGSMLAIPISCKNPARVMKFIELLNTDKYLNNLINFGIEDVHYKKVSENRISLIEDSGYTLKGKQYMMGNMMINYLYDGESDTKHEDLIKFNNSAKKVKSFGFVPNLESVKIQVTSCNNVVNEYKKVIEYGMVDPKDNIAKFNEKLKQAGIDEIVKEVQSQYDEWLAKKEK